MRAGQAQVPTDAVWTVPNALSLVRLITIPLFVWLALVPQADGWAALALVVGGITDYLDGWLARRWNQVTRVGQLLDPIADRLTTFSVLLVFLVRGIVPWWFVVIVLGRDVVLAVEMLRLKRIGITGLPVTFVGKAATFNLLMAFPLLMWGGAGDPTGLAGVARTAGWALALWGTGLYLYSGWLYLRQGRDILARVPSAALG